MSPPPLDIADTREMQFFPTQGHYVFKRTNIDGISESINLTSDDILKLCQTIPQFARQILQSEQPRRVPGLEQSVPVKINKAFLNVDTHSTVVLLFVDDEFGLTSQFVMDHVLAKNMGEGLIDRAATVQSAELARTRQ